MPKNLNDVIYGDRADVRANKYKEPEMAKVSKMNGWGDTSGQKNYDAHKCYNTHPPIPLLGSTIYGGSCEFPVVKDCDIYIGFNTYSFKVHEHDWVNTSPKFIPYYIADSYAPKDPETFKTLVAYTVDALKKGLRVHCGCIGGHGRTGTFLAAVVKEATGEEDAITWVREHYCPKVVESPEQVDFLHEHFGIKKVGGSKFKTYDTGKGHSSGGSAVKGSKAPSMFTSVGERYNIFLP